MAKIVLSTGRIRWNSPLNFNDPFDCYFSVEPKFSPSEIKPRQRKELLKILLQKEEPAFVSENPLAKTIQLLRIACRKRSLEEIEFVIDSTFESHYPDFDTIAKPIRAEWLHRIEDYRLFCVCEINDNLLLWSHYAHMHTGAAFQLECIKELDVPLLAAFPVKYETDAPSLSTPDEWIEISLGLRPYVSGETIWKRLVGTKALAWEYEKEWRVVTTRRPYETSGYEDVPFYPKEISKIFLGCKISPDNKRDILNLSSTEPFLHVEVFQAVQNSKKFQLDFHQIK